MGCKLLLYTDGVTEAKNAQGDMYGEARLMAVVDEHGAKCPEALVTTVREGVASFVQDAEQFDDITIMAIEL